MNAKSITVIWFSILLMVGCEKQYKVDDGYVHEFAEINVVKHINSLFFPLNEHKNFSPSVRRTMKKFLGDAKKNGIENIAFFIISPPVLSDDLQQIIKKQVLAIAYKSGFMASRISYDGTLQSKGSEIGVSIETLKYALQEPDCSTWSEYVGDTDTNKDLPRFGAADRHNLKEMIANEADLATPRKYKGPRTQNAITAMNAMNTSGAASGATSGAASGAASR
ncbi:MAG: CpaD family pilus assembly lipoprotein [Holosporaceae bacterium]|jgi:type IV pilus biogenesis protein CpaD/CtpE|nr:CpaD family pilus assembly lipoprotein [Holosporaceae bacterium]